MISLMPEVPDIPQELIQLKDRLRSEVIHPETGYWGVGISKDGDEYVLVLYFDKSRAKRQVYVASTYSVGGRQFRVKVVEASMLKILPAKPEKQSILARIESFFRKVCLKKKPLSTQLAPCFRAKDRPLIAGASVCDCGVYGACSSTGPFIDKDTGEVVWVTCAHCTKFVETCQDGSNVIGRPMCQPSPLDGGTVSDEIGVVYKATPNFWQPVDETTDTVAIKLNQGIQVSNYICGSREYFGHEVYLNGKYRTPDVGETICHSGRTTGIKCGTVQAIHASILVDYDCFTRRVDNVIITTPILQPGDSGSVGFDTDGTFLGLGFAGSDELSAFIDPNEIANTLHLVPYGGAPPSPTPTPTPTPSPTPTPTPSPSPTPTPTPPPTPQPWQIVCQIGCTMCNYINQQCDCNKYIEVTKVGDGKYEVIIKTTTDSQCVAGCLGCTILNLVCCGS